MSSARARGCRSGRGIVRGAVALAGLIALAGSIASIALTKADMRAGATAMATIYTRAEPRASLRDWIGAVLVIVIPGQSAAAAALVTTTLAAGSTAQTEASAFPAVISSSSLLFGPPLGHAVALAAERSLR